MWCIDKIIDMAKINWFESFYLVVPFDLDQHRPLVTLLAMVNFVVFVLLAFVRVDEWHANKPINQYLNILCEFHLETSNAISRLKFFGHFFTSKYSAICSQASSN